MRQRNAHGVVDLGGARVRRIEAGPIQPPHHLERDVAGDEYLNCAPGELAARLAAHMDRERRRALVEELLRVIVGGDDPDIGLERPELFTDARGDLLDAADGVGILGPGLGEELRCVGQQRPAEDGHAMPFDPRRVAVERFFSAKSKRRS